MLPLELAGRRGLIKIGPQPLVIIVNIIDRKKCQINIREKGWLIGRITIESKVKTITAGHTAIIDPVIGETNRQPVVSLTLVRNAIDIGYCAELRIRP